MKRLKKFLKWTGIVLAVIVAIIVVSGTILYNKKYDAPYPDLHASKDSAVIAHGKHLVIATAHCVECHYKPGDSLLVANGEDIALAGGGYPLEFPGGKFYAPNISSDKENGIGKFTDGEIARTLRYGVRPNGKALIPAMEFQNLSDEDITAIISYLRTVEPVKFKVPENEFNLMGKGILAFFIRPENPKATPPAKVNADTSVEYGRYVAMSISSCRGCHTERSMNTGEYIGEELAGGIAELLPDGRVLVAPNLTPDTETGRMKDWTFETFRNRFQQGKLIPESIMPWGQFKHLNETELKAIWNYLHSIKPVHKESFPPIQEAKS
jgi:mono/diheme cytochrome c family protein